MSSRGISRGATHRGKCQGKCDPYSSALPWQGRGVGGTYLEGNVEESWYHPLHVRNRKHGVEHLALPPVLLAQCGEEAIAEDGLVRSIMEGLSAFSLAGNYLW